MREVHEPVASGPGNGLAFGIFFALWHDEEGIPDVENTQNELSMMRDDITALVQHGYRVIVDVAAHFGALEAFVYGTDEDLRGARPAGLLWSSHGNDEGQIQQMGGHWISHRHVDPRRVAPDLRSVIFSACHVGRWEAYWREAFSGAQVYGWGKPVGFARAGEFYDPTSTASVRLDKILERDLGLRKGSIAEIHRAMSGGGPEATDPAATALVSALPYLQIGLSGGVGVEEVSGRTLVDALFVDGRHQRVTARLIEPSPMLEGHMAGAQFLCLESLVGPFPEDGFDEYDQVRVDKAGLHLILRDGHFARVQIEVQPFETILVQACLPVESHPAVVALALDEVATTADTLEREVFGADRR